MNESILAIKLKEYRNNNSLTQSELAEELDVSDKTISKWELGATYPSKKNMLKLAELLDVSIELFLLEEQTDKQDELKLSLKYGVISFCLIFLATMVIFSFTKDFSHILTVNLSEKIALLIKMALSMLSLSIPPAIIIGSVFYFYIFPKNKVG